MGLVDFAGCFDCSAGDRWSITGCLGAYCDGWWFTFGKVGYS